jgi:crotonobetainyl-CoA:carnitine CoA-transferase CaiB-like acyl-CoA transferase
VAAPQNLYLTADVDEFDRTDCWVAIAVTTNRSGRHCGTRSDALVGRWTPNSPTTLAAARHDLVDDRLAAWCLPRTGDAIVEALWTAGVPVAKVMQPHRQTELPQLRHRGFFEHVGHPVNVAASHSTLPVRLSNGPERFHRHAAPLLGEHNHELLGELGLSTGEIAALEDDGVIGTAPAAGADAGDPLAGRFCEQGLPSRLDWTDRRQGSRS